MKSLKVKFVKHIMILSMLLGMVGAVVLPTKVMAMENTNSKLIVSTDKSVVSTSEEVTMKIAPLRYEFGENGLLGINISVIADYFQEGAELQSIEVPKTYYKDKNGDKHGSIFLVRSVNYEDEGIIKYFPLDSENDSLIITKDQLDKQHGEGLAQYFNIMVRVADENGEIIGNREDRFTEIYMEDEIKVTYKINDSGISYKNSTYFYAYATMSVQLADLSSVDTYHGKTVLFSTTEMSYEDKNDHIHLEDINSGKIHLDNKGEYKNTRLALRIISDDIEVVSDNFTKNANIDGVYDNKIYIDPDNKKYYTMLPGEKLDFDFDYKLVNKDLKAGDTAKYRLIFFQDGYTGAINEYEVELVVTDNYTVTYESEKYHEYLLADENSYKITDEIIIDGVDELPLDHDFIGWEIKETGMFVEEGSTVLIKDLIVDDNTITLNAVYEDQGYNEDLDKDEDKVEDELDEDELIEDEDIIEDEIIDEDLDDNEVSVDKKENTKVETVKTGFSDLSTNYKLLLLVSAVVLGIIYYNLRKVKKI